MLRISLLLLLILVFCGICSAEDVEGKTQMFFAKIVAGEIDEAFDDLLRGSPILANQPKAAQLLKSQTKTNAGLFGKTLGFEKSLSETISPSLIRFVYIQRFENVPVVWELYYYKTVDGWSPVNITFTGTLSELLGSRK